MPFPTTTISREFANSWAIAIIALVFSLQSPAAHAQGEAETGRVIGFTCLGCHGIDGYRNAYPMYHVPRLGGQNPVYLKSSLEAYRSGNRDHPTMNAQGKSLTDEDIDHLVAWIARSGTVDPVATEDEVAAVIAVPTCAQCHAAEPTAATPDTPVLAGQHEDYLVQALKQYRDGSRVGSVMTGFAATLSEDEVEAISKYYASQDGLRTLEKDD